MKPSCSWPARTSTSGTEARLRAVETALATAEPDRLIFPFAANEAGELLETVPRHKTAHGALLADIVDVLDLVRGSTGQRTSAQPDRLSPSELRVLGYLPTNLTRAEIAQHLYVSVNTVNTHIRNIFSKLGVADRSAAVRRARESRLLSAGFSPAATE